jgi:hypothetical protein
MRHGTNILAGRAKHVQVQGKRMASRDGIAIFSKQGSRDSILVILEHRIEELLEDYFL